MPQVFEIHLGQITALPDAPMTARTSLKSTFTALGTLMASTIPVMTIFNRSLVWGLSMRLGPSSRQTRADEPADQRASTTFSHNKCQKLTTSLPDCKS